MQYTTEDFKKWGKEGGDMHKTEKPPGYFSRISKMRKNPGRKRLNKTMSTYGVYR